VRRTTKNTKPRRKLRHRKPPDKKLHIAGRFVRLSTLYALVAIA